MPQTERVVVNRQPQIAHIMWGRLAAWSPLWWWSCLITEVHFEWKKTTVDLCRWPTEIVPDRIRANKTAVHFQTHLCSSSSTCLATIHNALSFYGTSIKGDTGGSEVVKFPLEFWKIQIWTHAELEIDICIACAIGIKSSDCLSHPI